MRERCASLAIRARRKTTGLWNAFMGPTSVYSARSSSDFLMSGNNRPFPAGTRRLLC